MSGDSPRPDDPMVELEFALAEGDAIDATTELRARVLHAAAEARAAGATVDAPSWISGADAFRRAVAALDELLGDLSTTDWSRPALRDLDIQGLVGHLIGVEETFASALAGQPADEPDHIVSTQAAALRQQGYATEDTRREWFDAATTTLAAVADLDPATPTTFYGVTLPLDALLVVRAFEMWIHDEDVRRAAGRALAAPDPERLARMVGLITTLLPAGLARAGCAHAAKARLVLTGTGGGTWDMNLDGADAERVTITRVVVDATQFCRVVGNREDQSSSGAIVTGDTDVAAGIFLGAAALALD